jgi:competence protein ComGC
MDKKAKTLMLIILFLIILILLIFLTILLLKIESLKKQLKNSSVNSSNDQYESFLEKTNVSTFSYEKKQELIKLAVENFNETYINILLYSLGINDLHKSSLGYGNPVILINVGDELWTSEISEQNLYSSKGRRGDEDLIIYIPKQNLVTMIYSDSKKEYIKDLVKSNIIRIELISSNTELYSKGYLTMYNKLNS